MGITKQYLRYTSAGIFGAVCNKNCNAVYLKPNRFVVTGGTNLITLWDTRLQRKVKVYNCESQVTILKPNSDATLLAVGCINGKLFIYDLKDKSEDSSQDPTVTFHGHSSEITSLIWDESDTMIVTGGKDTNIVLWDIITESGIIKHKGHKGTVTQLKFFMDSKYLVSSSTDATLKIWEMSTNNCVHTIACNTPIWDFDTWTDGIVIAEAQIRLFIAKESSNQLFEWETTEIGSLLRQENDRASHIKVIENKYLVTAGQKSSNIEVFYLRNHDEIVKQKRKRLRKHPDGDKSTIIRDLIRRENSVKACEGKIKSIDWAIDLKENKLRILCSLPSNQIEIVSIPINKGGKDTDTGEEAEQNSVLGFDGHRKLVRGVAFSKDKTAILSASADSFRVWNRASLTSILCIQHSYQVVSTCFCPGDRHFLAGTTCGHIILCDISNGTIIQKESGGNDNVWALDIFPNNLGFSAVNGNLIQFFDFSMSNGKLQFEPTRQLDVQESVLCIKMSSNMKYIAAGLLDSTIKIFYFDTLKYHLSMYGHKLPIVSIDISQDGHLLASASGDKTIKIWGMDFGDCHTSLIHGDGLVGVSFIENTHYVASVNKDTVNFYDADNFQRIQTVKGHVEGGATCMAVGGLFVVSAGRDQTIRLYNRTQEILVLDDEREREREEELDKDSRDDKTDLPTIKTAETEQSADKLIEALDIFNEKSDTNPLIAAYGAKNHQDFLVKTFTRIKASEFEQSLKLLPNAYVNQMIPALVIILENYPLATEMAIRCINGLMQFHFASIRFCEKMQLKSLHELAEKRIKEMYNIIGFNMAGLDYINDRKNDKAEVRIFKELIGERKRKKKNRDRNIKRAILNV